jgi:membrane protein YqaA with SNARE-associated domain
MANSPGHWLYETLRHRLAPTALALVAFLNSVALRIPAELLLAPMAFVKPRAWLPLAALTTAASVVGGIVMYALGLFLFDTVGQMALDGFGLQEAFKAFVRQHATEGPMAILFASMALVPYKAIALASGVVEIPFWQFVAMSILIRGVRYGVVSFVAALAGGALLGDRDSKR